MKETVGTADFIPRQTESKFLIEQANLTFQDMEMQGTRISMKLG
jgi:hypothetical protein